VSRKLKTIVVLLMLALLPLRALAALTIGDCAVTHHEHAHDGGGTAHSQGSDYDEHEHCASASFVASAASLPLAAPVAADRVTRHEPFAAGFVPDHLDPPPLAL
jgi:hypothetical protein